MILNSIRRAKIIIRTEVFEQNTYYNYVKYYGKLKKEFDLEYYEVTTEVKDKIHSKIDDSNNVKKFIDSLFEKNLYLQSVNIEKMDSLTNWIQKGDNLYYSILDYDYDLSMFKNEDIYSFLSGLKTIREYYNLLEPYNTVAMIQSEVYKEIESNPNLKRECSQIVNFLYNAVPLKSCSSETIMHITFRK